MASIRLLWQNICVDVAKIDVEKIENPRLINFSSNFKEGN